MRSQKNVEILKKRAAFLEQRVAECKDKDLSYDRAERNALLWAIDRAENQLSKKEQVALALLNGYLTDGETDVDTFTCQACRDGAKTFLEVMNDEAAGSANATG